MCLLPLQLLQSSCLSKPAQEIELHFFHFELMILLTHHFFSLSGKWKFSKRHQIIPTYTASHSIAVHNMAWRKTTERFWQFKMKMFDSILHPASQGFCEPLNIYQWTQKLAHNHILGQSLVLEFGNWDPKHFGLPIVCSHADFTQKITRKNNKAWFWYSPSINYRPFFSFPKRFCFHCCRSFFGKR